MAKTTTEKLLETFDKLGIPLEEQKKLAGVAVDAVFDSVSVATTFKETLAEKGTTKRTVKLRRLKMQLTICDFYWIMARPHLLEAIIVNQNC